MRVKDEHGEVDIDVPRDRNGSSEPQIMRNGQTRLTDFDSQIPTLYAKGMSTRDIVEIFNEMYGAEVSATLVSRVTEPLWSAFMDGSLTCWMKPNRLFILTASSY